MLLYYNLEILFKLCTSHFGYILKQTLGQSLNNARLCAETWSLTDIDFFQLYFFFLEIKENYYKFKNAILISLIFLFFLLIRSVTTNPELCVLFILFFLL